MKEMRMRSAKAPTLTVGQARKFLAAAAYDPLYALYVLALTTGLRQGELLALHWADVDLEAGLLEVRGMLQHPPAVSVSMRSEGRKSRQMLYNAKTRHSHRLVRLSMLAVDALRGHQTRQREDRLVMGAAWHDLDLVFCNAMGWPCEADHVIRTSYKPLLARAGVPSVNFHMLRDSAATLLLAHGVHPTIVAAMLDHTTLGMTLGAQFPTTLDEQQKAADTMDRLFG